jgi:hypothetical protein
MYIGRYALTDPKEDRRWINQVGLVRGVSLAGINRIQRNDLQGFSLDLNLGWFYIFNMQHSSYYAPIELIAPLSLWYWIGKK